MKLRIIKYITPLFFIIVVLSLFFFMGYNYSDWQYKMNFKARIMTMGQTGNFMCYECWEGIK